MNIPGEDNQDYEYFLSLLNLFAEMCLDRNYFSINILENIYKFDLLFSLIKNDDIDEPLRSYPLNLLLPLHINRYPLAQLNFPNSTLTLDEINNVNDDYET